MLLLLFAGAAGTLAQDAPSSASEWGAAAEWHQAQVILVHEPGAELWVGVAHPWSALYEKPFDPNRAAAEHRAMVEEMRRACGLTPQPSVEIHNLVDVLVEKASKEQLLALAKEFIEYDFSAIEDDERRECEEERAGRLVEEMAGDKAIRPALVAAVIQRMKIEVSLDEDPDGPRLPSPFLASRALECGDRDGYDLKAEYSTAPLMNLYFTRDQMITTAKGVVLTRPKRDVRRPETVILEAALRALGVPILARIQDPGTLEGGDFLPASNMVYIGQGDRTNMAAIQQLMDRDAFGSQFVAVVKDPKPTQQEMHLDTYFNIIGSDLVVLTADRIPGTGTCQKCPKVDLYRKAANRYERVFSDRDFSQFLREARMTVIPVSRADQEAYGTNFLTIRDRWICAVKGISQGYLEALRRASVRVRLIDLDHLQRGYGAAHCTTQVLRRRPI